jgi:Ca2+-binding RTX toxin-like protein
VELGAGDDSLIGGNGSSQQLYGEGGNDTLVTGNGSQTAFGNDNNDSLVGVTGSDSLDGGNGNDTINGGLGNDTLIGNTGTDWLNYAAETGAVTVNLTTNRATLAGGDDSLSGFEGLLSGSGHDLITGGTGAETVYAEAGNDSVAAGTGNDWVDGGTGNDTLNGGDGNDTLDGDAGNDFASYASATAAVDVQLTSVGNGSASGAAGSDSLSGIEGLIGSDHNDTMIGGAGANTILAGDGVDSLSGGTGDDWLDFGSGDENYLRDPTNDSGSDTLIGDDGQDTLDLGENWAFLSEAGGFSLYRDQSDTIYAQGWEQVVCFAEGTRIVTLNGEDAVENLRVGDMVLAMRGGQAGFELLRWVGFMEIAMPRNAAMVVKTAPILITAGAIATGLPAGDLRVSPDHAMEIEGHLIPAKHLVNGVSIIQEVWCRRVRYFHLELEAHGLLLSEGTWSESYLDDGNRDAFNNTAMTGLFLDFEAGRSKGQYDHQACLPVLRQGLKLDEIQGRIFLRAAELARAEKVQRKA